MPVLNRVFVLLTALVLAVGIVGSAAAQDSWDSDQNALIQSFVTQKEAVDEADDILFQSVVMPVVQMGGQAVPVEVVFSVIKQMSTKDPADYAEAYNPERIVDIRITGDVAEMDLRDTKTEEIQHFKFQRVNGVWMWSGLN